MQIKNGSVFFKGKMYQSVNGFIEVEDMELINILTDGNLSNGEVVDGEQIETKPSLKIEKPIKKTKK